MVVKEKGYAKLGFSKNHSVQAIKTNKEDAMLLFLQLMVDSAWFKTKLYYFF